MIRITFKAFSDKNYIPQASQQQFVFEESPSYAIHAHSTLVHAFSNQTKRGIDYWQTD